MIFHEHIRSKIIVLKLFLKGSQLGASDSVAHFSMLSNPACTQNVLFLRFLPLKLNLIWVCYFKPSVVARLIYMEASKSE